MNTKSRKHYANSLGNRLAVVSKGQVVAVHKALMGKWSQHELISGKAAKALQGYKALRYQNRDVVKYSGRDVSLQDLDKAYGRKPRIKGLDNARDDLRRFSKGA